MADRRFTFLIHRAQRVIYRAADRALLGALGITSTQLGTLYYLRQHDGCRLSALSEGLMLNNSAITGAVSRMVRAGLVEKCASETDARASEVFLTAHGRRMIERSRPLLAEFNQALEAGFSEAELEIVARFLQTTARRFRHWPEAETSQIPQEDQA